MCCAISNSTPEIPLRFYRVPQLRENYRAPFVRWFDSEFDCVRVYKSNVFIFWKLNTGTRRLEYLKMARLIRPPVRALRRHCVRFWSTVTGAADRHRRRPARREGNDTSRGSTEPNATVPIISTASLLSARFVGLSFRTTAPDSSGKTFFASTRFIIALHNFNDCSSRARR